MLKQSNRKQHDNFVSSITEFTNGYLHKIVNENLDYPWLVSSVKEKSHPVFF